MAKDVKLRMLDKLTELVKLRVAAYPVSGEMVMHRHLLRREHAESMSTSYIAMKLKQDALEAYHRSSGKPLLTITPELALVIVDRLTPTVDLTKSDYELMVSHGYPSLSAAARAHGIDRKTLKKNLGIHGIPNPWKSRRKS